MVIDFWSYINLWLIAEKQLFPKYQHYETWENSLFQRVNYHSSQECATLPSAEQYTKKTQSQKKMKRHRGPEDSFIRRSPLFIHYSENIVRAPTLSGTVLVNMQTRGSDFWPPETPWLEKFFVICWELSSTQPLNFRKLLDVDATQSTCLSCHDKATQREVIKCKSSTDI